MNLVNKKAIALIILFITAFNGHSFSNLDEGMFPLSDLNRVDLKKAGLLIDQKEIFNPGHIGLVDALVRVGGCTGSFVSKEGLIITNHHCAFGAVQLASTTENDYLTNGFVARTHEQEIEAKGLTIRITDSYEDVSTRILNAANQAKTPAERIEIISLESKKIAAEAVKEDPSIVAEVSEMFIGKSYVLFRYKTIEDVRLVYVPKRSIGEFGGETDNWVWPRHTGDYSFLRAYVGPDGKPAKFSKSNVPYQPKKHLTINPNGVKEEDFTFILGYPGRTFRHRPAQFIEYQEKYLLPYTASLFGFQNEIMREAGLNDKSTEIALATRIQRNSNVRKNYQGKMKGLKNINLVQNKRDEDEALSNFINQNPELKVKYGTLMDDIDILYKEIFKDAERELWFGQIYNSTNLLNIARQINRFKNAMLRDANPNEFFKVNSPRLKEVLEGIYASYRHDVDIQIFKKMIEDASNLPYSQRVFAVDELKSSSEELLNNTKLSDQNYVFNTLLKSTTSLKMYSDELLDFQATLNNQIQEIQPELARREGVLNKLMGDYVEVKEQFQKRNFVPDANSTLRLTYGYIRGYSPEDAVYMSPFTTIKGIVEKGRSGLPEYRYPKSILEAWEAKNFGPYEVKELGDVPVNILYNMDTTGGNSGSPIMNAKGELIGVNFDRAYDATINDFAWNESYSRSIGVDIRYVLWVADKIDNADFLLKEIGL
jgi:hypothetical protein